MNLPTVSRRGFLGAAGAASVAATASPALHAAPGPRPSGQLRIGVVGGGFGLSFFWHLDPDCKVVAVCDLLPEKQKLLAERYRCTNTYKNFREFLKHPDLDAVAVFTPAPLHAFMAVEAMKAGKHVISAVPAGLSVEELEEILDTVRKTGLRYMMAETSYYRQPVITCRELAGEGKFGTIFHSEAEYHHEGLMKVMFDDRGLPTWRHGLPPMLYPTHCTGLIIPVIRERLSEVTAVGWGDGHEVLRTNQYKNPFWNETAFFKTSKGHSARVAVYWHVAAGGSERGQFYGDRMSYLMERPEGTPNTFVRISSQGKTVLDSNGYPEGETEMLADKKANYLERLPEPLRVKSGHGDSHTFLTHEFVRAVLEDRHPTVNVWEAIAYTLPGIIAHQSALRGGESLKIRDYGQAPA
ncbi:Gfo/Idh/MocA family protein [Paludibaculum fermentans]|uniref:Gfo/Idh/MocA family protein n=1 Tax=Paludibaculum fermentans TaxID=1473598 RepID=UPI003EBE7E11